MTAQAARPAVPTAAAFLADLLDPGSFRPWTAPASRITGDTPEYRQARARAQERAGTDESVVTGEGLVAGHRIAVVCSEFRYLAGSLGVDAAQRAVSAIERATALRLPVLASPASGGTRMQEGTPAFLRMAAIAHAVAAHRAAGLPYLVHLRHPSTGGAFASWGSLGQVTTAEPGALVGFLGPRVYEVLHGEPFPAGVQTAEHVHEHGIVDAVLPTAQLRSRLGVLLGLLAGPTPAVPLVADPVVGPALPAWEAVTTTRRADRPGLAAFLGTVMTEVVPLGGDGEGAAPEGARLCLGRIGPRPCVIAGFDRDAGAPGAGALRTARRGMRLAAELHLPLVTVIDTAGGELSVRAEEAGIAGQIARCVAEMGRLATPTVSVLLGQGCGGAALALLPADRVVAARHAWLSPLPLEGASAILHGTADRAAELAESQHIRSVDLAAAHAVDRIVDERPDAADEPAAFLHRVAQAVVEELDHAEADPARRIARWSGVGF